MEQLCRFKQEAAHTIPLQIQPSQSRHEILVRRLRQNTNAGVWSRFLIISRRILYGLGAVLGFAGNALQRSGRYTEECVV